jgi:serine/threonine-protein kinase
MIDRLSPIPEPRLPKVFGRYLLLRRLSRGGMGEIFLAKSGLAGFEKLCVIKKVLPHLGADRDFIRRFVDEAQVAIKLNHGNIAQVFEVGMAEGEYFLALEYVEGRDLRRTITRMTERGVRMPVDLALMAMRDVASGLAYAHRKPDAEGKPLHLVHCDVSPPNVIVSFEGEVKVIDFGIAKSALRAPGATDPKIGFGKYGYMAPEQLIRGGIVDKRTDVYAAGVLLHELLTGKRLFQFPEGADYRQMARIVARGQHGKPSDLDPSLRDLDSMVLKAVAPDMDGRFQHAEGLRDALVTALAERSPTLTSDRLGSWMRELFAEEVAEEKAAIKQAAEQDLTPFADEMAEQTGTVTFAAKEETTGKVQVSEPELELELPSPWPRRGLIGGGLLLGAGLAFLAVRALSGSDTPPPPQTAPAQPFVVQNLLPPPPIVVVPPPASQPASVPASAPVHKPNPPVDPKKPVDKPPAPKPDAPPQNVQFKYQAVSREYAHFKQSYGNALDADWNDILELATYGTGDDKQKKLDAKLDSFRHRMAEMRGH